ncbi:MAG: NAD(P)/FAD-dependent oxidoreductase [Geminicoccaceae bacterium]
MRIAIIGSGIAGLSCAWLLDQAYDITLYEADDRLGGHSHTIDMPTSEGLLPVDTGFIVYNERNYPNLTALFEHFEVPTKDGSMSFGVSVDDGWFEYSGSERYSTLFAQKSNMLRPGFLRLLLDIGRFNKAATRYLQDADHADPLTIGAFLDRGRYGADFCERYLLPMSAAIWSASLERIRTFPAFSLFRFFNNHGLISINDRPAWRTVDGGSRIYVDKLTEPFKHKARLKSAVKRVTRFGDGVEVQDVHGCVETYDAVVLACHADQALAMIETPTLSEHEILGAFDYQENRAVVHSDPGLMPKRQAVWSSWNYLASSTKSRDVSVSVTYWLNRLQSLSSEHLALVSLNPIREPDPATVVAEFSYAHPQFDQKALSAQQRLQQIQGRDRLWFAGAHWGYGFHEDGLLSGLRVAAGLGITPPWWSNVEPLMPRPSPAFLPAQAVGGGD